MLENRQVEEIIFALDSLRLVLFFLIVVYLTFKQIVGLLFILSENVGLQLFRLFFTSL